MPAPCGRKSSGHRHSLTYLSGGPVTRSGPRRTIVQDRCNSLYLWSSAARAILLDREPFLDGDPLKWSKDEAYAYLVTHAPRNWIRGIDPR